MMWSYVCIPVVTAGIGWLTNVVAVKMLFHPRKPVRIFGWRIQGAIPKRQLALAQSIGGVVERDLLPPEELARQLQQVNLEGEVGELLDRRIHTFLDGMTDQLPMLKMFLTDSLRSTVATKLKEEVVGALPELKEKLTHRVGKDINLQALIEERIGNFSVDRLEGIVMGVATRELKLIEVFGGLLGFLIGLGQVGVMWFLQH